MKQHSFSIRTFFIVLVALLLTLFVTNGARATTYRLYAKNIANSNPIHFYTWNGTYYPNGEWGNDNLQTEVINGETWSYYDYNGYYYNLILHDGKGSQTGNLSFYTIFSQSNIDKESSTDDLKVTYIILSQFSGSAICYTTRAEVEGTATSLYHYYVMFVGNTHPSDVVFMHTWDGMSTTWPGKLMKKVSGQDGWFVNAGNIDSTFGWLIFNFNGSQSQDISIEKKPDVLDRYFIAYTDDKDGSGHWSVVEVNGFEDDGKGSDIYLLSEELNGKKLLPQFKLVPNRLRNGGPISDRHLTVNFKRDAFSSDLTSFTWYLMNAKTGECFRPRPGNSSNLDLNKDKNGKTRSGFALTQKPWSSDNTVVFHQPIESDDMSFTVFLDTGGEVWMNINKKMDDKGDYVLIGNFTSALADVDIRPDKDDGRKSYTKKLWWKNNESSESEIADADSLVYYYNVERPKEGWGQLYLAIAPGSTSFPNYDEEYRATNKDAWETAWKTVIRPQVHAEEAAYQDDARALNGGLIENLYGNGAWLQSINPEVSPTYSSYEFSMNVTYSTYRLIFKTDICVIGTAVQADDGSHAYGGSFDIDGTNSLIRLQLDEAEGCYKWPYNGGKIHIDSYESQKMPEFRFVVHGSFCNTYEWNFSEDANAPTSPFYNDPQRGDNPCANGDTQFRNRLAMHQDGSTSRTNPFEGIASNYGPNDNCRLYLPSGDYVLRFYIRGDDEKTYYYTLDRDLKLRDYSDVEYQGNQRTVKGLGEYKCLTTWSDYLAYEKPEDVNIFVVESFEPGNTPTAVLRDITDEVDCLPANVGLILATKTSADTKKGADPDMPDFKVLTKRLTVYADPDKTYDLTNKLACAYTAQPLPQTDDQTAYYLFGAYKESLVQKNGSDSNFLLGLWLSDGTGRTYPNSAYLPLPWTDQQSVFSGTIHSFGGSQARSWMRLNLGGYGNDGTTGLTQPAVSTGSEALSGSDAAWYTLQGAKTGRPSAKGIYIHNGHKEILK